MRILRPLLILLALLLVVTAVFALPSNLPTTTNRISTSAFGGDGDAESSNPQISTDGQLIVFQSAASNLVSNDTNGSDDIFLFKQSDGAISLISKPESGQANAASSAPSISGTGRYIVFESAASNLVSGDNNGDSDIFLLDTFTDDLSIISRSRTGTLGNNASSEPKLSGNGRFVVFTSKASNLVSGDSNGRDDIFVYDIIQADIERVSISSSGNQSNGNSFKAEISADGRYVVFGSDATNLMSPDSNGQTDIFLRDTSLDTTTLISVSSDGTQSNNRSTTPSISSNGKLIVFASLASNLVANDANNQADIFLRDLNNDQTERISEASDGEEANDASFNPNISPDGKFVVFESKASNLITGDSNSVFDIYRMDRDSNSLQRVSVSSSGIQGNDASIRPHISSDGNSIVFSSNATNLVSNDNNLTMDVFLWSETENMSPTETIPPTDTPVPQPLEGVMLPIVVDFSLYITEESEPNDIEDFADGPVGPNVLVTGDYASPIDVKTEEAFDFFYFELTSTQTVRVSLNMPSTQDLDLQVSGDCPTCNSNSLGLGRPEVVETTLSPGKHTIRVSFAEGDFVPEKYELLLEFP